MEQALSTAPFPQNTTRRCTECTVLSKYKEGLTAAGCLGGRHQNSQFSSNSELTTSTSPGLLALIQYSSKPPNRRWYREAFRRSIRATIVQTFASFPSFFVHSLAYSLTFYPQPTPSKQWARMRLKCRVSLRTGGRLLLKS